VVPGADRKIWLGSLTEFGFRSRRARGIEAETASSRRRRVSGGKQHRSAAESARGRFWATRFACESSTGIGSVAERLSRLRMVLRQKTARWLCIGSSVGQTMRDERWESWWGKHLHGRKRARVSFLRKGQTPLLSDRSTASTSWIRASGCAPTDSSVDVDQMIEDGNGGYWTTSREEGLKRLGPDLQVRETVFRIYAFAGNAIRALLREPAGANLGRREGSKLLSFEVTGKAGDWKFEAQKIPGAYNNTVAIHEDHAGRIWVGYHDGLAYRDEAGVLAAGSHLRAGDAGEGVYVRRR